MNARFRKGKNYRILSGKFKGISLKYYGFERDDSTYEFRDGEGAGGVSIKWVISANNSLVLSQLESEKRGK